VRDTGIEVDSVVVSHTVSDHDEKGRVVVPSTDRTSLERIANDVLEVWDQYATASSTLLVPHRARFGLLFG
jgi:DNA-binding transcriptional regulator/RsmH inhibitor MraZ